MKRKRSWIYLALVLACTLLLNDASGLLVLGGAAAGVGFLLLPRARRVFGRPFLLALAVGGPALNFGAEILWAQFGSDGAVPPAAVVDWIVDGSPPLQLRINSRLQAMSAAEKTEVVALLAALDKPARRSLRAYEIDAVPLALARGVSESSVARLCEHHRPEVREAVTAAAHDPKAGLRPGHVACARFVSK